MHTNWCVLIEISMGIGMLNFWSVINCLCNGVWSSLYQIAKTKLASEFHHKVRWKYAISRNQARNWWKIHLSSTIKQWASRQGQSTIRNLGKRRIHNLVGSWEFNKEENSSLTLQHEVNEWIWEYQLDCQWCSILNLYTFWTIIIVIFEVCSCFGIYFNLKK